MAAGRHHWAPTSIEQLSPVEFALRRTRNVFRVDADVNEKMVRE
jgi:hypothetical protein